MREEDQLINVFTDTEMTVVHLKSILTENGIQAMIKNEYESGQAAGYVANLMNAVDLYVMEKDVKKATPIIDKFKNELK